MSGEENLEKKGSPTEMAPQEDGTKVLLKDEVDGVAVQQAKFVANPNGDAKIDIGTTPAFAGLTKEELMKYSNDPFWVRLRWFLFILFWLGWIAMLVMAIVIIVQAPGCEPPPVLLWVEQEPMMEIDHLNLPVEDDLMKKVNELGISSVYFPQLINEDDFTLSTYNADALIEALKADNDNSVTDLPSKIIPSNPLYENATKSGIILPDGTFNFANKNLPSFFVESILTTWIGLGVKGFLMSDPTDTPEKKKFIDELNLLVEGKGGAIGSNVEDHTDETLLKASNFESFLEEHVGNWTFLRYKANHLADSLSSEDDLRLMTFGLFLFEATPILTDSLALDNSSSLMIKELTKLRAMDGIKFGDTSFANSSDAIGFTRAYKGTPAYAIALNFNGKEETLSFKDTPNIAEEGTVELVSKANGTVITNVKEKVSLYDIKLGPKEAIAIQFVANFA